MNYWIVVTTYHGQGRPCGELNVEDGLFLTERQAKEHAAEILRGWWPRCEYVHTIVVDGSSARIEDWREEIELQLAQSSPLEDY